VEGGKLVVSIDGDQVLETTVTRDGEGVWTHTHR